MEAISRSCLPEAAARTKRQRKATCCGVLGAASHRTTCARSSADKLTSGLILAMHTCISYWPQYVYLFMIHTTRLKRMRAEHTHIIAALKGARIGDRAAAHAAAHLADGIVLVFFQPAAKIAQDGAGVVNPLLQ